MKATNRSARTNQVLNRDSATAGMKKCFSMGGKRVFGSKAPTTGGARRRGCK